MNCNCCECEKHKDKVLGVLGILWNENLDAKSLRDIANKEIDPELPLKDYELVINSMDLRTAQDYGQFDRWECTKVFATRGPYIVNTYLQWSNDRHARNMELLRYVHEHHGSVIIIHPKDDEELVSLIDMIKEKNCTDLYIID